MQMGAHKRQCAKTSVSIHSELEADTDATNILDDATISTDANEGPDVGQVATLVIHTPVTPLQSLVRRERGWGRVISINSNNPRPILSSGTLARDFREVCLRLHYVGAYIYEQFCTCTNTSYTCIFACIQTLLHFAVAEYVGRVRE